MATFQWSNLPADILSTIGKLFTSDVDVLRFRSVCSSWRTTLPRPPNPISFPLKLPLLRSPANPPHYADSSGFCTLNQNSIYRLSPAPSGPRANDPSFGWLFKVSKTNPNPNTNTFSLVDIMIAEKLFTPPRSIPPQLNLLHHRISELRKSYSLGFPHPDSTIGLSVRKVIGLHNFVSDCKFAALVLRLDGSLTCWKFGDDYWTEIDTKGYKFQDVVSCNGRCYALDRSSALVSFDSDFNLTVAAPPRADHSPVLRNFLVECESDLYMVQRVCTLQLECAFANLDILPDDYDDDDEIETAITLKVFKFNKSNGKWRKIVSLGDRILVLGVDASFGVSATDFKGSKGNRIYLNDIYFSEGTDYDDNHMRGVYHFDDGEAYEFDQAEDVAKLFYPGRWLFR